MQGGMQGVMHEWTWPDRLNKPGLVKTKKAPTAYAVEASILVELGGVEPPSESTLPLVLHA